MFQNNEGQQAPNCHFELCDGDEIKIRNFIDLFQHRTVIIFGLPGAFTPTCSQDHLPRYNELAETFQKYGVDEICCVSVNDAFVMQAWQKQMHAEKITFLPDGEAKFTKALGMATHFSDLGLSTRSRRYSMLIKNGLIEKMFVERDDPSDPLEVSDADTMLHYLAPSHQTQRAITLFTKPDCPFCAKAKNLLTQHKMAYEEISIGKDATLISLQAITGRTTVPQIFIGGKHIGGSEDLIEYLNQ
jgi:glutaredoxin-like protein